VSYHLCEEDSAFAFYDKRIRFGSCLNSEVFIICFFKLTKVTSGMREAGRSATVG
jgi:hypothetical protein